MTPGVNALTVETGDIALNSNMAATSVQINFYESELTLSHSLGVAVDTANNRALVVDSNLDALVAVDLTTGVRSILSV